MIIEAVYLTSAFDNDHSINLQRRAENSIAESRALTQLRSLTPCPLPLAPRHKVLRVALGGRFRDRPLMFILKLAYIPSDIDSPPLI